MVTLQRSAYLARLAIAVSGGTVTKRAETGAEPAPTVIKLHADCDELPVIRACARPLNSPRVTTDQLDCGRRLERQTPARFLPRCVSPRDGLCGAHWSRFEAAARAETFGIEVGRKLGRKLALACADRQRKGPRVWALLQ
jgi:hypothetical protein